MLTRSLALACVLVAVPSAGAQPRPADDRVGPAVHRGVEFLVSAQEGEHASSYGGPAEWPYEGVYRVGGEIPVGYRVGGTAIVATALLRAPGYAEDPARREAVSRATRFVCDTLAHPLMSPESYKAGYDVRGWGYSYALAYLLALRAADAVPAEPAGLADRVDDSIRWCVKAVQSTEIPKAGGWSYARPPGRDAPGPASPFMTAPTLTALFEAKRQGFEVDAAVVDRAVRALERSRTATGTYVYAGAAAPEREPDSAPGAVGRMLAAETALTLAGGTHGSPERLRGAVDAFIAHWEWLEKRRAQPGTHEGPYGIAPYYFYYAHLAAAHAIELLPRPDRAEYRRRLRDLCFRTRAEDGTWNDRVFPRSASYGTAMTLLALMVPETPEPARWEAPVAAEGAGTSPAGAAGSPLESGSGPASH